MSLLHARGLSVTFRSLRRAARVVDKIDLDIAAGETLALVGESGCGKSMTALALMGLTPPPGRVEAEHFSFNGQDLRSADEPAWQRLRGSGIALIFQDSGSALNPVRSIGSQFREVLRRQRVCGPDAALRLAADWLHRVGLPDPRRCLNTYPHQLSGGQRQRVMIALAMACAPKLLIADEPTTALDVTLQAQVLELLRELMQETHTALLLITHDLGLAAGTCQRVAVMYAGRIVEQAPTGLLFEHPLHPYSEALLASRPLLQGDVVEQLISIPGLPPPADARSAGCAFQPRCHLALARCAELDPAELLLPERRVRCHLSDLSTAA